MFTVIRGIFFLFRRRTNKLTWLWLKSGRSAYMFVILHQWVLAGGEVRVPHRDLYFVTIVSVRLSCIALEQ